MQHHANTEGGRRRGFTLIEVLISLALVSFLLLGTAQMMILSIHVRGRCDRMAKAAEYALIRVNELKSRAFSEPGPAEGNHEELIRMGKDPVPYIRTWTLNEVSARLKMLTVTCYARDMPQKRTRLDCYLSPDLGF